MEPRRSFRVVTASAINLSPVGPDEVEQWAEVARLGFLDARRASSERIQALHLMMTEQRLWTASRDGVAHGTYRSWDVDLPVPGRGTVPGLAITSVTVLPGYRRRGVASAIIGSAFAECRERGLALAYLIPSQAPIYGRFGFGAALETVDLVVDTARVHFARPVDIVLEPTNDAGLRAVAPDLYASVAAGMPGALPRTGQWWDWICGLYPDADKEQLRPAVIARDSAGSVVGTASYRPIGEWTLDEPAGISVHDLTASTPAAYQALWQFLADLEPVDRVIAENRPVHEPLTWMLTDRRAVSESHRTDFDWVRILDVPTCLTARAAQGVGRVVLEVVDPDGFAAGRWQMDADEDGRVSVAATGRSADVTMPVQTLGSIYLGANPLTRLQSAGLVDEHRAGAVRLLDRMLSWAPEGTVGHTWF
ncbi:GNAT family N-acetyltransferase [Kineosporia babensis]